MQQDESSRASTSSLAEMLSQLQAFNVAKASFTPEGSLSHVEFFAPVIPLGDDATPEEMVKTERDLALTRLAARGQRQNESDT